MLTKTHFLRGRDCARRLWLDLKLKDLRGEPSESDQDRMDLGRIVGEIAREAYPQGVLVPRRPSLEEEAALTRQLIEQGETCLFEGTFIYGELAVRVDILRRGEGGWILNEVKSSSLKPVPKIALDKIEDAAYQLFVLRGAGLKINQVELTLVDTSLSWDGSFASFGRLLGVVDVTERCEKRLKDISVAARALARVFHSDIQPEAELDTRCKQCDYFHHCFANIGADHLIFLPKITGTDYRKLREGGIESMRALTEDHKLSATQRRVVDVLNSGRPYISDALAGELDRLEYPAAFVDFETTSTALPVYSGTRAYEQICFQWSAHRLQRRNVLFEQYDFLAEGTADPRAEFCRTLWNTVKECKTIVHYTKFEITQLEGMADQEIPYARELYNKFVECSFDLERIVSDHVYLEGFRGRTSIKVVLPTLVPRMSYQNLRIGDGNAAACAFRRTLDPSEDPNEVVRLREALLEYCAQDTLAMVEIYLALVDLAKPLTV